MRLSKARDPELHKVKRSYGDVWLRYPQEKLPVRKLYFVRHGHYLPTGERGLSTLGIRQAKRLAKRLSSEHFDMIHFSTSQRAKETALILAEPHGRTPQRPTELLWEVFPPFYRLPRPKKDEHERYESMKEQMADDAVRLKEIFERFLAPPRVPSSELVVCHGNVIRSVAVRVLGMKKQSHLALATRNAALTEIHVDADGTSYLYRYDDVGHLPVSMQSVT
jgi:broad specificity phosphatase PhoE